MAVGDDMTEEIASPLGTNITELGQTGTMVSPEDVAWADSCLTKDPNEFDIGWTSMKEALLETLDPQRGASAHSKDKSSKATEMEISSNKEATNQSTNDINEDFWSRHDMKDVFLPTYNESLRDLGTSDPEMDLLVPAFQLHTSAEDEIFKIWDLNVSLVEDEDLIKQLNRAITETPVEPTSFSDHSTPMEGSGDVSIDDLISGIADLSLRPNLD